MSAWPIHPVVYEINTWAWLNGLTHQNESPVTLENVPQAELERLARYGFNAIWLMGVWQRSEQASQLDQTDPQKLEWYRQALEDYSPEDVVGSPCAPYSYNVDPRLGGNEGLASLRERLKSLGLYLILDFIPNHLALDHPWTTTHPEYLLQGNQTEQLNKSYLYFNASSDSSSPIFAHGRDRYYTWSDTVQLDYRNPATRQAMTEILLTIAARCDGVRCDMAMLAIRDVFCGIWGGQFDPPGDEFWSETIGKVKTAYPNFLMIAEAYWDREYTLQQQGFDYTYDKRLYDRLKDGDIAAICNHLRNASPDFQNRLVRFIENHDEERAVTAFGEERSQAAAMLILTLPGMRLLHEGQIEGRELKLPVQLGRRPEETSKPKLDSFYRQVLDILHTNKVLHNGQWEWLEMQPGHNNPKDYCTLVAYHWWLGQEHRVVVINLAVEPAEGLLQLSWLKLPGAAEGIVRLDNMFGNAVSVQDAEDSSFFDVKLCGYGYTIFKTGQSIFPPGLTLQCEHKHQDGIYGIAWSADGRWLASGGFETVIRLYDHGILPKEEFYGHTKAISSIAWSPDNQRFASGSYDRTVRIWVIESNRPKPDKTILAHRDNVLAVAWSPDGQTLASGGIDQYIYLWNTKTGEQCGQLALERTNNINALAWSPSGDLLASGAGDSTVCLWNIQSRMPISTFKAPSWVSSIVWHGQHLAAGTGSGTVEIWDTQTGQHITSLEGHTERVLGLTFSQDGKLLASKSADGTVQFWESKNWASLAELKENGHSLGGIAFNPQKPVLATRDDKWNIIRIWELDEAILLGQAQKSVNYTTAKLVLVGDSGVGKTGLGWRLAHGKFKEQASTHGQQFWSIPQLDVMYKDGTECEAVLWDLAGQHVYRQIHAIFLENVAAALVLFDPSNRQEPLKGAQFWLEQLKGKSQLPPTILVGARIDRGAPALSQAELDQFCQRYGIRGGYISTSAMSGEGLDKLLERLKALIPWDTMTATVTSVSFKRIKDYVLALKEKTERKGVLVSPVALRAQLEQQTEFLKNSEVLDDWEFSDVKMMTAVGHLETHGYVAVLRSSAGEEHILLTPDLLVNLAASIMLLADKNPRELGAVSETELLQGKYPFDELKGLEKTEQQILLDAAVRRFLEHNICFRETLGSDTLLIFPSLIKQKRPLQDALPAADDISYVVHGRVENLYASLVVLLGHTPSFTRINQWQNQAQYEMGAGQICGFRLIEEREGEIELVLYYGDELPARGREQFQELFEQFLYQREADVTRFPPVACPKGHRIERATVIKRVREGKTFVFCDECGEKTSMPDFDKPQSIGIGASPWLQREEAVARLRSAYEVQLTRVKGYRRSWATPRCYLIRLPEHPPWAENLIHDLRDAGVYVIEQAAAVKEDDFVILLDTSTCKKAFNTPALAADAQLIQARLKGGKKVLSLACEGRTDIHKLEDCTPGNFCDETHYPVSLFNLVLNLYAIPLTHASFAPLRRELHEQWEQTLAGKQGDDATAPLKVFISYSHKDEEFKDELVTMLAGLQRQGIIDPWQDRCIEEGDAWYQAIQDAMNDCDLAVLLVSQHFIASRFIQDKELPRLLQRRQQQGLRVVPIIVRPCKWQSEPALGSLQALPSKDGKPIITFSKNNGKRDQVWTDIASVLEKRVRKSS